MCISINYEARSRIPMKLLEKIKAAIARLGELTADELAELRTDIVSCAAENDGDSDENLAVLAELSGYADQVIERSTTLDAQTAEAAEAARVHREKIAQLNGEKPAETEDVEAVTDDGANADLEAIAASGGKEPVKSSPSRMAHLSNVKPGPEVTGGGPQRPTLVAAGQLVDHSFGDEFEDRYALGKEMAMILDGLDKNLRPGTGKVLIARARWGNLYPDNRRLSGESTSEDFRKIGDVARQMSSRRALAASGGVPLPTNVDYSMDVWATADRPVRDGLAAFNVDRGGLLYRRPPTLADLSTATAVWTNANDIDPVDPATKPVYSVVAQDTTQVFIAAIPTRLGFGNLMGQFDPETIAANTDLAIANAARVADLNLLTNIQGFATNTITSAKVLGASRDLLTTIIQVASAYRFTNRLNRDQMLTAIFPIWGMDMIKQDRVMELAHDGQSIDVFQIPDSWVNEMLSNQGIKVIWAYDGLAADAGAGTYVSQNFAAFTADEGIPAYPTEVVWNLFIEGSIQFLDGGRLDLGVVRDSILDSTNDYETFVEPFEAVANRAFAGGVLQIVSTTHPTGSSSEGIAVS
jgi:hypothetical protein